MPFIGQFRLDGDAGEIRLAYVFMSDLNLFDLEDEEEDDGDYESDENEDEDDAYAIDGTFEPEGGENAVIIQPDGRIASFVTVRNVRTMRSFEEDHLPVDAETVDGDTAWEFLGGDPVWLQGAESPGPGWQLIGQLTDRLGHNFGDAGIAYIFVSPDGVEGRFLWQCH